MRAVGAVLFAIGLAAAGTEPDGVLGQLVGLIALAGVAVWLYAVVEISEIYGLYACLLAAPGEVWRYRLIAARMAPQTPVRAPSHLAEMPSISCHGRAIVDLGILSGTEAGKTLMRDRSREHNAMFTLLYHSPSLSRVSVWIDGEDAGVVSIDDIRPYAAIMDAYGVNLSSKVRVLPGRVVAMLADVDTAEAAASEGHR